MNRIFLAAVALCCAALPAWADTAVAMTWSPGPIYIALQPYLLAIFNVVVFPVLLGWICIILKKKLNLEISNSAQAELQQSAANAAGRVLAAQDATFANMKINIDSPVIAEELPRLQTAAAAAIDTLGLTPDRVAHLLLGKVGQLQAAVQASTPAVVIAPAPDAKKAS